MKLSTLNGKMSLISVGTNAKTKKGDLYSSFVNAAIYYFLKHGDFEKMPETIF